MIIIFITLLGLIFGSFLNVCIFRIPRDQSISYPPSHCTKCNQKIKSYDLIPIISYIFLRGKCRFCGDKISFKYPLIELITGVLFALLYIKYGFSFQFIKFAVFICLLLVIGIIDFETTDVYLKTTLTGIIAGIIFIISGCFYSINILPYILGGLLGGGIISVIILLTHGMGWGDAEICFVAGLFLGFKLTVLMLFLAFVIGGFTGILLIITKKKSRKDYIPFGPFIAIAAIITVFLGEHMLNYYMTQFIR